MYYFGQISGYQIAKYILQWQLWHNHKIMNAIAEPGMSFWNPFVKINAASKLNCRFVPPL